MKKIENILLAGCAYAIAIISIFYAFAAIGNLPDAKLSVSRFFLIVFFGQIISVATFLLRSTNWHAFLRYALHYTMLFLAFYMVFVLALNTKKNAGATILIALVVFTFLYLLVFLLSFLVKKLFLLAEKAEKSAHKNTAQKNGTQQQKNKKGTTNNNKNNSTYSPRFK